MPTGGSRRHVGGRVDTSGHFFIGTTSFFYDVAFLSSLVRFLACPKSLFCEKRIFVFIINGPNLWDFEQPRTQRCTIHPCTLTTTLTKNTSNHCISVHIWISLASVCFVFCHRRADFERISCSERAPKAKKLSIEASFVSAEKAPTNATAEVPRTLHLQLESGHPYA